MHPRVIDHCFFVLFCFVLPVFLLIVLCMLKFRSLNGEGMFNWRLVLDFEYLPTEDAIVVWSLSNAKRV